MAKILLIDDDQSLCTVVASWLTLQHNLLECAYSGRQAEALLESFQYDLIILDLGLPDVSGLDILRKFRRVGGRTPVIILTGKNKIEEKELGFESGADDYVTKPFEVKELAARVRAVLRRPSNLVADDILTVGQLSLDSNSRRVTRA